jgi:FLYWCH zinc finger domain
MSPVVCRNWSNTEMLRFVPSQKGGRKLVLDGFLYQKEKDGSENKEIWRCEVQTCKARVHSVGDRLVSQYGDHNHTVVHGKVLVETARGSMKHRGETTEEATRSIVHNELLAVPVTFAHLLPKKSSLSRDVQRHRQIAGPNDNDDVTEYSLTQSSINSTEAGPKSS